MTELEQLKADHAAIRAVLDIHRKCGQETPGQTISCIEQRIAELEGDQDDPWAGVKQTLDRIEMRDRVRPDWQTELARYVRHLEARVRELEARPVPPLDAKRVYATWRKLPFHMTAPKDTEPYPLADPDK